MYPVESRCESAVDFSRRRSLAWAPVYSFECSGGRRFIPSKKERYPVRTGVTWRKHPIFLFGPPRISVNRGEDRQENAGVSTINGLESISADNRNVPD